MDRLDIDWTPAGDSPGTSIAGPHADPGDVAEFRQWMQSAPPTASTAPGGASLAGLMEAAVNQEYEQHQRFNKSLRRVAKTGDPLDGLAVSRQLSELYLSHGLTSKVIGKSVQALETLGKLT